MIGKVIHYTWFSGEEMPQQVKDCIASWHKYLPNYEFKLWDMNAVQSIDSIYMKEALSVKKYAFAADYVRLYALYYEGGIWLDTDVELKGSFDAFLDNKCFIGKERLYNLYYTLGNIGLVRHVTSHCFGAEKGHPYIKKCLDYYEGRHFIESSNVNLPNDLKYNMTVIPYVMARLALDYGFNLLPKAEDIQYLSDGITIYPTSFFDGNGKGNCIAIHHNLGGWTEISNYTRNNARVLGYISLKQRIKGLVGRLLYKFDIAIFRLRK